MSKETYVTDIGISDNCYEYSYIKNSPANWAIGRTMEWHAYVHTTQLDKNKSHE